MNDKEKIDKYMNALPKWQMDICVKARQLIHKADPNIVEAIKFTNRPYFLHDGNVCAFLATKHHVNVFVYDPIAPDPHGIINQGYGNTTARSIQITENNFPNEKAFVELIKAVVSRNKIGGWRKLEKYGER